ncbi:MAG: InlB B-repeat-containing protein, partial [Methanomicrobiales archaeon]|nr:InlB B-repeat-containing protein [Methanomicrobiales archaeon]
YLAEYPGIDFTQLERYDEVKNYNMSIYIDLTNGNLYKVGHRLNLHNNVEKEGYTFEYYQRGENRLYDGDTYTIGEAERLVANYKAIDYAVKFYDGDNELVEYRTTYNVETGLALPNYGKENYLFFGWYTDPDFSGAPLEEINIGQTGNLNLYAYLEKELIEEVYNITYHLNGGHFPGAYLTQYSMNEETLLPVPVRSGYQFAGWYNNSELTGDAITKITIGSVFDKTFYAKWTAIGQTDAEKLNDAKTALNIGLQSGDTLASITGNVTLPTTGMHDAVITWATSNSGAITTAGVVTRGASDEIVTLTATIKINSLSDTKVFNLTVKEATVSDADKALDAKNALEITYASGDSATSVTQNVTLPTTGMHSAVITWATSNSGAITTAGAVTRSTANDVTVTLTATIKVNLEQETKTFTLLVKKIDAATEYTITFNLNGGAWPTSGGTGGYTNRDVMITDFLTEFHGYLTGKGVITMSASDFMHGAGKTSGFDGSYNNHMADLRALNDKTINPEGGFVNQAQYNKWVPLIDLMDEFVGKVNPEQAGEFWGSNWTANARMKPFVMKTPIGQVQAGDEIYTRIPTALQSGGGGTPITPPSKYTPADNDITLPVPVKDGDPFIGWYDNPAYQGEKITKILKGSTGNKVLYARYQSTEVPEPAVEYTITFNLNGGQFVGGGVVPSKYQSDSPAINLPIPARNGYEFVGWYDNAQLSGSIISAIPQGSSGNKVFYAKWAEETALTDAEKALDAKNALDINLASGDTANNETKNVILPTSGMHGAVITWASNNAAISVAGVVTRGENDVVVTLTATIKVGTATETKTFTLTVAKL